jgi:hypothetical protein
MELRWAHNSKIKLELLATTQRMRCAAQRVARCLVDVMTHRGCSVRARSGSNAGGGGRLATAWLFLGRRLRGSSRWWGWGVRRQEKRASRQSPHDNSSHSSEVGLHKLHYDAVGHGVETTGAGWATGLRVSVLSSLLCSWRAFATRSFFFFFFWPSDFDKF